MEMLENDSHHQRWWAREEGWGNMAAKEAMECLGEREERDFQEAQVKLEEEDWGAMEMTQEIPLVKAAVVVVVLEAGWTGRNSRLAGRQEVEG